MKNSNSENKKNLSLCKVNFDENHEVFGNPTTVSYVSIRDGHKDLLVAFYCGVDIFQADSGFRFATGYDRSGSPTLYVSVMKKSRKENNFKKIASDKCVFGERVCIGYQPNIGEAARGWFTRSSLDDPFFKYLKKAKFVANSDKVNNLLQFAQQQAIEAFPKYNEERYLKELPESEQQKYIAKAKSHTTLNNSKLGKLRRQIAKTIDKTLDTDLEEEKLPIPIKKIEKAISDKLFGKVKE